MSPRIETISAGARKLNETVKKPFVPSIPETSSEVGETCPIIDFAWNDDFHMAQSNEKPLAKRMPCKGLYRKAPVGVEPTMTDLQSVALATWPRSQRVYVSTDDGGELSFLPLLSEKSA